MLFWSRFLVTFLVFTFILTTSKAYGFSGNNSMGTAKSRAEEIYNRFKPTIDRPRALNDNWIKPLVGGGVLKTLNGTPIGGNVTITCHGGGPFLKLNGVPRGSGDVDFYVRWSFDEGQTWRGIVLAGVSAPCANGFIVCSHPTAWADCKYYVVEFDPRSNTFYASNMTKVKVLQGQGTYYGSPGKGQSVHNGTFEEKVVPVSYKDLATPCVCIKNVCGSGTRNSFALNPGYVLGLLGGAFISALQKHYPDFIITSSTFFNGELTYYGQSRNKCTSSSDSAYVRELSSYLDRTDLLKMRAEEMYVSLKTDPKSPVKYVHDFYQLHKNTMSGFNFFSCTRKYVVSSGRYAISDLVATHQGEHSCANQDISFTQQGDRHIQLKSMVFQEGWITVRFRLFSDILSKLEKVTITATFGRNAVYDLGTIDDDICVKIWVNNRYLGEVSAGGSLKKRRTVTQHVDIPPGWLSLENEIKIQTYYCYSGDLKIGCPPIFYNFILREPLDGCYVANEYLENGCSQLEQDPNCEVYEEYYVSRLTGEKVPLKVNGMPTGLRPLAECVEFCKDVTICRDDWTIERKYRCKTNPVDYTELMKRQEKVTSTVNFTPSSGLLTFDDIVKQSSSGSWVNRPGQRMQLIPGENYDSCIPVCKLRRPETERQVEIDMSHRGFDKPRQFEFVYRLCSHNPTTGRYECVKLDSLEEVVQDCSCDTGFKEAITILQALRQAADDLFCAER